MNLIFFLAEISAKEKELLHRHTFFNTLFENLFSGKLYLSQRFFLFGCLVLLSLLAGVVASWLLYKMIHTMKLKKYYKNISGTTKLPIFWIVSLNGIYFSLAIFCLSQSVMVRIHRIFLFLLILLILRAFLNIINVVTGVWRENAKKTGNIYSLLMISLIKPVLKTIFWLIGILAIMDRSFHVQIAPLLAGAGVASMAVAFAAQSTIANLFGAVMLIFDRPFLLGDDIQVDNKRGNVQNIGLRSVQLLGIDGTIWYIPNKLMADSCIVNYTQRAFIRYTFVLGLTYSHTPEQLQKGKEILQDLLSKNPLVDMTGRPPRISFENFGAYSLDLNAVCWFNTKDYREFAKAKDELNSQILKAFNENHLEIAFPTQTLCIENSKESV